LCCMVMTVVIAFHPTNSVARIDEGLEWLFS
jgi:hypothetical protein